MRRITLFCMALLLLSSGCARKHPGPDVVNGVIKPPSQQDELKMGVDSLQKGLKAQDKGDMEGARQAFVQAGRHLNQVDRENRETMQRSLGELKKIVDIAAFEYDSRGAFDAMVTYLKMQNAYMDGDRQVLTVLEKQFNESIARVQEATVQAKQKRIEELSQDVAQKREEIKKQVQADPLEVYPTIYVVKRNETLPSIASRHEIYNDSFMWPLIYKANRDQIKDPKVVYVGQDLKIPRDISVEEIIAARREAGAPDPEKIPKDAYTPRRK
jgi:LysM repeat protein